MTRLLKLTAILVGVLIALSMLGYSLQAEQVLQNRFALESHKQAYEDIIQTNSSLNIEAMSTANLEAVEQKIAEFDYVAVNEVLFIAVPYELLARKGR